MMSKTLFRKRSSEFLRMYRIAIRENAGIDLLLAVLLFLIFPMTVLVQQVNVRMSQTNGKLLKELAEGYSNYLETAIPLFGMTLLLVFTVVFSVSLFRYMHDSHSVDLFHALPVGRVPMLLGRWCAGMTLLAVPAAFNFFLLQVIAWVSGFPALAGRQERIETVSTNLFLYRYGLAEPNFSAGLWQKFGLLLLMTAAAFTFCVLALVCSGSVMDAALSALGVNFGVPLLFWLAMHLMKMTLPGMDPFALGNVEFILNLSPFLAAYLPFVTAAPGWFLPWWICFVPAVLAGTCLLYRRRKSESAGSRFAFPAPKIMVRFLLTACGGIGLGLLFRLYGTGGFWIGLLAGSVVVHVILEALYSRGFTTLLKSAKWYAAFLGCFAVFYGILAFGCFGYDTRVPAASEVESVSVQSNIVAWCGGQQEVWTPRGRIKLNMPLKDPESIRTVLNAHKNIAALYRENGFPYQPDSTAVYNDGLPLNYRLKDGRTMQRRFLNVRSNTLQSQFVRLEEKVVALPEYQRSRDVIFYLKPQDIEQITLPSEKIDGDITLTLGSDEDKALLLNALQVNYTANWSKEKPKSLRVNWSQNMMASGRLSEALGGYTGKISIPRSTYEYCTGDTVDKAIRQIGGTQLAQSLDEK